MTPPAARRLAVSLNTGSRFFLAALALAASLALWGAAPGAAQAAAGKICGGIAGIRCGAHETCRIDPPIYPDKSGTCERASSGPQIMCNMLYQPVCGRNGKTYSNSCHAKRAGVRVRHAGACHGKSAPKDPAPVDTPVAGGGTMCPMIYQPVCGADGKTYPNTCHAKRAGTAVAQTGACPEPK